MLRISYNIVPYEILPSYFYYDPANDFDSNIPAKSIRGASPKVIRLNSQEKKKLMPMPTIIENIA